MRPSKPNPQTKNYFLNLIVAIGLFSGVLITVLLWLKVPDDTLTPLTWLCLGVIGLGSFLYSRRFSSSHPRWMMILAALAAVSLVYLFPELFRPVCGGMPRAFASPSQANCAICIDYYCEWSNKLHDYHCWCDEWDNSGCVPDQPPTIQGSLNCSQLGQNGWCSGSLSLELSAIEPQGQDVMISGDINGTAFACTASPAVSTCSIPLPEGSGTANYTATSATELTASDSSSFQRDSVQPQIDGWLSGTNGNNGWFISPVDVNASASDPQPASGIETFEYNLNSEGWKNYTGPINLSDGVHSLNLRVSDAAGNIVETIQAVQIDTVTPTLDMSVVGTIGANGWYSSNVQINAAASDSGSGLGTFEYNLNDTGWIAYSGPLELTDGIYDLKLKVVDKAGNVTEGAQTFLIDTLAPTIDVSVVGTEGENGWYTSSVQVSASAGDAGSGLSILEVSIDGGTWSIYSEPLAFNNGLHSYQFRAFDNAGNLTETTFEQIQVDTILPVIDLPGSWKIGQVTIFKVQDDGSGLANVRLVVEDEDERYPKVTWDEKLNSHKFKGEIDWNGRFKDGQLAPPGGEYYVWVKVRDAAGNEIMQAGQIVVPVMNIVEELIFQTDAKNGDLVSGAESSGTIEQQPTPHPLPLNENPPPQSPKLYDPPRISLGGNNNTAKPTSAQVGKTSFNAGGFTNSPASQNNPSSILWGATATAALGAFVAEAARKKEAQEAARRAANAAVNQARKLRKQAYIFSQKLKKQAEAIARNQIAFSRVLGRKELDIEKGMRSSLTKAQAQKDAFERAKKEAYAAYRAQEVAAQTEIVPYREKAVWWENTKNFVKEKIISPINSNIYQPYVKPAMKKISEVRQNGVSWANENLYQPYIKPVLENGFQKTTEALRWINKNIFQPHIKPLIEKSTQKLNNGMTWVNENITEPLLKPAIEKAMSKIATGIAWANENLYQPRLQPLLNSFVGNIYEPYISPRINKVKGEWSDRSSWINENLYRPFIQPVVADIDQYIYQPYFKPSQDKAMDWWNETWEKYGENVHNILDTVGFIPAFGDTCDAINGLIYLAEGRYIEASLSVLAIIPLLGDLGKFGKFGSKLGIEVVEETGERVVKEAVEVVGEFVTKEVVEEAGEKFVKNVGEEFAEEVLEVTTEKAAQEVSEELVEKGVKEFSEEFSEKTLKETSEGLLEKATKETAEEIGEKALREASENTLGKTTKNIIEEASGKNIRNVGNEVFEQSAKNTSEKLSEGITKQFTKKTLSQTGDETVQHVLKDVVPGKVTKLPEEMVKNLSQEGANNLASKLSIELGGKKVWVSAKSGLMYISSPPPEALKLAKQLSEIDLSNIDEVRDILRQIGELTSRGSGNRVVLGPFDAPKGIFIQEALDNGGVFWDTGDELWEALEETLGDAGIDMFEANDQFMRVQIERGIDRFDIVHTNVDKALKNFNSGPTELWKKISYTRREILNLATLPDIPYQQVGNSWIRIDLLK